MKAKDVMKLLGICRVTLYNYVKNGLIKTTTLSNGYSINATYKIIFFFNILFFLKYFFIIFYKINKKYICKKI
jgi:hypothetical protein